MQNDVAPLVLLQTVTAEKAYQWLPVNTEIWRAYILPAFCLRDVMVLSVTYAIEVARGRTCLMRTKLDIHSVSVNFNTQAGRATAKYRLCPFANAMLSPLQSNDRDGTWAKVLLSYGAPWNRQDWHKPSSSLKQLYFNTYSLQPP